MRITYTNTFLDVMRFQTDHQFFSLGYQAVFLAVCAFVFNAESATRTTQESLSIAMGWYVLAWLLQILVTAFILGTRRGPTDKAEYIIEIQPEALLEETRFNRSLHFRNPSMKAVQRGGLCAIYVAPQIAHVAPTQHRKQPNRLIAHMQLKFMIMALVVVASFGANAAPPKNGDEAPDYVGKTLEGDLVKLSAHRGKAVVISYWATWCQYCLKELPILGNIQRAVGKDHMQVIAVNTESRDVFRKVARALQPLDIGLAYDPDSKGREAYGVGPIPHMVIIGRDGVIDSVHKGYGEESLDKIVAAINRVTGAVSPGREPGQGKP